MKVYAKIKSEIIFIDEKDLREFKDKYKEKSYTILETLYFNDGNILKIELLESKSLKKYDYLLSY